MKADPKFDIGDVMYSWNIRCNKVEITKQEVTDIHIQLVRDKIEVYYNGYNASHCSSSMAEAAEAANTALITKDSKC